ncbi:ABC transporter substrate-binding protein [Variovorax sp. PBL-E5]|uniref:ABC transporter substrate-binding protein n=1 Tax=Variovorax sp. PBL-E5 TaxID=434014 RepID=UPI001317F4B6|nr:ABC transporter substrate-binding protein [Variovorax sp. PBL-E5]VTU27203.1 Leu/Ile/Val-binding protein precursor [Variovorax sp. PBL-E5]
MTLHRRAVLAGAIALSISGLSHGQDKEIPVGVFNSLTGTYAFGGVPIQNGMKLALEEANAKGLPGGNKFRIVEADTAGDKGQTISLVNQFVKRDNAMLILGPTVSADALGAAPVANDLKVPILAIGSSPGILATGPWAFKIQATPVDIMGYLGKLAVERLGVKRIVLLHDQSNDGYIGQKDALADYLRKAGVTIAADEKFVSADSNFLALATKVATIPTDAIFIAAPAEVAANLILQIRQAGLDPKVKFVGPSTLGSAGFVKAGGKAVEGTYFVSDYSPNDPSPMNQAFVKAYQAKYKSVPDNWAAMGYALGQVAVQAVRNAGPSPDRTKIRDELARLNKVPMVLGNGTWSVDAGRNPSYGGVLLQVKAGNFVTVQ